MCGTKVVTQSLLIDQTSTGVSQRCIEVQNLYSCCPCRSILYSRAVLCLWCGNLCIGP